MTSTRSTTTNNNNNVQVTTTMVDTTTTIVVDKSTIVSSIVSMRESLLLLVMNNNSTNTNNNTTNTTTNTNTNTTTFTSLRQLVPIYQCFLLQQTQNQTLLYNNIDTNTITITQDILYCYQLLNEFNNAKTTTTTTTTNDNNTITTNANTTTRFIDDTYRLLLIQFIIYNTIILKMNNSYSNSNPTTNSIMCWYILDTIIVPLLLFLDVHVQQPEQQQQYKDSNVTSSCRYYYQYSIELIDSIIDATFCMTQHNFSINNCNNTTIITETNSKDSNSATLITCCQSVFDKLLLLQPNNDPTNTTTNTTSTNCNYDIEYQLYMYQISSYILYRIYQYIVSTCSNQSEVVQENVQTEVCNQSNDVSLVSLLLPLVWNTIQTKVIVGLQNLLSTPSTSSQHRQQQHHNINNDTNNNNSITSTSIIVQSIVQYLLPALTSTVVVPVVPVVATTTTTTTTTTKKDEDKALQQQQYIVLQQLYNKVIQDLIGIIPRNNTKTTIINIQSFDLIVVTTILCSIVPSLLEFQYKQQQQQIIGEQSHILIQSNQLWDIILICIQQGITISHVGFKSNDTTTLSVSGESTIANESSSSSMNSNTSKGIHQLCRRRGIYLLRLLIEHEIMVTNNSSATSTDSSTSTGGNSSSSTTASNSQQQQQQQQQLLQMWYKFIICYETIEMETEQHLIDQIWETVQELFYYMYSTNNNSNNNDSGNTSSSTNNTTSNTPGTSSHSNIPVTLKWEWLSLLLSKCLIDIDTPPVLRKLCIYRILNGQAGIEYYEDVDDQVSNTDTTGGTVEDKKSEKDDPRQRKTTTKKPNNKKKNNVSQEQKLSAPMSIVPTEFVVNCIIPSFDSLVSSVGWNIHMADYEQKSNNITGTKKKTKTTTSTDIGILLGQFLTNYLLSIRHNPYMIQQFFYQLWHTTIVCTVHRKTIVYLFDSIATTIQSQNISATTSIRIPVTDVMLQNITSSYSTLCSSGSIVYSYQNSMLRSLAIMLQHSYRMDDNGTTSYSPISILSILALYPLPTNGIHTLLDNIKQKEQQVSSVPTPTTSNNTTQSAPSSRSLSTALSQMDQCYSSLTMWLSNLGGSSTIHTFASAVATAYVDGTIFANSSATSNEEVMWDVQKGLSERERITGKAIGLLSALATVGTTTTPATTSSMTASAMLWQAIYKGFGPSSATVSSPSSSSSILSSVITLPFWPKSDRVSRAMMLLEVGCTLHVVSGMGNGDLIVSSRTDISAPPPPNIEAVLLNAIRFLLFHIHAILRPTNVQTDPNRMAVEGGSRSNDARQMSSTYSRLIRQIQILGRSYPSSITLSTAVSDVLQNSFQALSSSSCVEETSIKNNTSNVQYLALIYAGLACSGDNILASNILMYCQAVLDLTFTESKILGDSQQPIRSVFQIAKWGSLSLLLPMLFDNNNDEKDGTATSSESIQEFVTNVFTEAIDSVEATPSIALIHLFNCVQGCARYQFLRKTSNNPMIDVTKKLSTKEKYLPFDKVIDAMFRLVEDCRSSTDLMYMLDEMCSLLFHPTMLYDEYQQLVVDTGYPTPVRDAFRRLIQMAGKNRPHISRIVLSRICSGWLNCHPADDSTVTANDDNISVAVSAIPYVTDILNLLVHKDDTIEESGISQALLYEDNSLQAEKVPDNTNETSVTRAFLLIFLSKIPDLDNGLASPVLTDLLHPLILRTLDLIRPIGEPIMYGTAGYCVKMRGWQALCILSRFISDEIADAVLEKVFFSLEKETIHNQIRYFMEIFSLRYARKHPQRVCAEFVKQVSRRDLSLQMISSLMILGGNLFVGRYQNDFFKKDGTALDLQLILASVIPWLSSTQGFSRAIAQLLTHKLIPMVIDVAIPNTDPIGTDWYLQSVYRFLEENKEMKRLRQKQSLFFHHYEVDSVCTPEGVLSIPVDDGGESAPKHLIDVIKLCLQTVYDEGHDDEIPTWRQVEQCNNDNGTPTLPSDTTIDSNGLINFQRKIVPVDALNLALDDIREKKLRNAAGRKKLPLIVCASLVDKVPNLGGLARTSEIFAADKLIVPDIRVTKMDNFKALTVGAHDWIDIEECQEPDLLKWLRQKKEEGYRIVGVEQTSSSQSLLEYKFTKKPTVLLLGKEKEGIPVELLQVVDDCIEIPQLGIIRSLNVHVAAALCIYEHRKQAGDLSST